MDPTSLTKSDIRSLKSMLKQKTFENIRPVIENKIIELQAYRKRKEELEARELERRGIPDTTRIFESPYHD